MTPYLLNVYLVWVGVALAGAAPSTFLYLKGRLNA